MSSPQPRNPHQQYTSSSPATWRPSSKSPVGDNEPQSRTDAGQQHTATETYTSRKPSRRSPVPDHHSHPFRSTYLPPDIGRRTPEKDYSRRVMDNRIPFRNIDERLVQKDLNKPAEAVRISPGKEIVGNLHSSRSASPRKDTPGTFRHRLTAGYRDPDRVSPFSDSMSQRHYDKSPVRDRRSPPHGRRSPDVIERPSFRDTSPNPIRDARHSPFRERNVKQPVESRMTPQRKNTRSPVGESRVIEASRGYRMKPEAITAGDSVGSHQTENKVNLTSCFWLDYIMRIGLQVRVRNTKKKPCD